VERTTIQAEAAMLERWRRAARSERISLSELVRRAVEQRLAEARPSPRCAGAFRSGEGDLAERSAAMRLEPDPWRS